MMDKPDMVISIDFGMTCTGVAYCNVATGSSEVRYIQRWPGRMMANENKVPSLLLYPKGSSVPSSWGFSAETVQKQVDREGEICEWFKIYLDEERLEERRKSTSDAASVPTMRQVEEWYTQYFQFLYRCIETRLRSELASSWEDAKIEFIFSVPTTWDPSTTVERFRGIIKRAGFGVWPSHTATIGLTEAEAAAVYTARNTPAIFKEDEILLVCDIGGGTTDLSVFRIKDTANHQGSLRLEQIDVVFGATIGSTELDNLFEDSVLQRLEEANRDAPLMLEDLQDTAWDMRVCKEFQNAKCSYGIDETESETEFFFVRIPRLDRAYTNERFGIRAGEMVFRRDDLRHFFDAQIDKLCVMIDKQLSSLLNKFPHKQVAHMILSGGLGNSAYVRDQLRKRYGAHNVTYRNAASLRIRVAPNPQMVVCIGNVADRVQRLKSGQPVLGWRCCRSSYGLLCKIPYDRKDPNHFGLQPDKDELDGKLYIRNWVDWFIKKGEPVSSDTPIVREFARKCQPATAECPDPPRIFPTEVICSDVDVTFLPTVQSDFGSVPLTKFKLKNRHWWNMAEKYHRIEYVVKVNLGPADICFELWHQGVKLSKDEAIKVKWAMSSAPRAPVDPTSFYHSDPQSVALGVRDSPKAL
ncbi:hypothetical protein BU24DRAFT_353163 [Aaosphaeria arxii CBS 175.79]|uniref:Actin-like ATPase domain-containing protein n=1 Tax=Aaosphaeria arxii CBS 175.79 TaxID=1450172 RepID=A0A6A5XHC3_9PLEO|nr:uncharacterized protein BU24DRAFT_353163 [Aaosphaeria arxii CBS 175.79]KAF2012201.1 hypothetical protein BU24DRAFT_353163 [Aaosphaeria arxii CBS 175.79]